MKKNTFLILIPLVILTVGAAAILYGLPLPQQRIALRNRIDEMNKLVIEKEYVMLIKNYMHPLFQKTTFELESPEEVVASLTQEQKRAIEESFSYISTAKPTFKYYGRGAYFYSSRNTIFVSFIRLNEGEPWCFIIDSVRIVGEPDPYESIGK